MTILHALILGVVEGVTEFLPISSTGHLILTSHLLGLPETDVLKSFEIAIQLGAILAALVFYAKTLLLNRAVLLRVIVAFLPTAVIGLAAHDVVKQYLLGSTTVVLCSLFLGGVFLIVFESMRHAKPVHTVVSRLPLLTAFLIGCAQAVAIVPGVSRSAATIIGGLALGVERAAIVDFSFLLAIPTMAAATALDLLKSYSLFSSADIVFFLVGFVSAFVTALIAIRWLLAYVRHHSFLSFGIYRIVLVMLFLLLGLRG